MITLIIVWAVAIFIFLCWWSHIKAGERELERLISGGPDSEPVYPRWCWACEREGRLTQVGWTRGEEEKGLCPDCGETILRRLREKAERIYEIKEGIDEIH